jgi:hypothetical protein
MQDRLSINVPKKCAKYYPQNLRTAWGMSHEGDRLEDAPQSRHILWGQMGSEDVYDASPEYHAT